jgi:hypothetical protein
MCAIKFSCALAPRRNQENPPKKSHPSHGKTSYFLPTDVLQCARFLHIHGKPCQIYLMQRMYLLPKTIPFIFE